MAVPTQNTYDLSPPRRPGINDVLLAIKGNAANRPPPNPTIAPDASEFNMLAWLAVAAHAVVPLARLVVQVTAGAYSIVECKAPGDGVVAGSFTITKNGTGDITISWAAATLPGPSAQPGNVEINDTVPRAWTAYYTTAALPVAGSPAVRVVLQTLAGAAVDAPFTLKIT